MDDNFHYFISKPLIRARSTMHYKKTNLGDLIDSPGSAAFGESVISKRHWTVLGNDADNVAKLRVRSDKRGKNE